MHENAVHVVAADVEHSEIRAGIWRKLPLPGVLSEVVEREGLSVSEEPKGAKPTATGFIGEIALLGRTFVVRGRSVVVVIVPHP